jgi:hypothetical protein
MCIAALPIRARSRRWVLHNAVFGLLLVSIGVTLGGLCVAAAGAGVVHTAWRIVGPVGGVLLAVAAACTPAIVDGSNVLALGLVGFITWLLFVATGSRSLLRRGRAA